MHYILKNKKVIEVEDILEWEKWFKKGNRVVKQETLPNGYWVSTVFLGLDHSFGLGLPLVFETMVFSKEGDWCDLDCQRYTEWQEAVKGHKEMIKKWLSPSSGGKEKEEVG